MRQSTIGPHPMQITLNLDETLINEALQLTNLETQEEMLSLALQELVRSRSGSTGASRRKKNLLDLAGQVQPTPNFDHKALRDMDYQRWDEQLEQDAADGKLDDLATEAIAEFKAR
jgi:hypothetical protein